MRARSPSARPRSTSSRPGSSRRSRQRRSLRRWAPTTPTSALLSRSTRGDPPRTAAAREALLRAARAAECAYWATDARIAAAVRDATAAGGDAADDLAASNDDLIQRWEEVARAGDDPEPIEALARA